MLATPEQRLPHTAVTYGNLRPSLPPDPIAAPGAPIPLQTPRQPARDHAGSPSAQSPPYSPSPTNNLALRPRPSPGCPTLALGIGQDMGTAGVPPLGTWPPSLVSSSTTRFSNVKPWAKSSTPHPQFLSPVNRAWLGKGWAC